GYIGFSIPFAMSLSALLCKSIEVNFFKLIYPWVLISFSFLTGGITFGSWWAYYELGWGGWWFWDPVENASLMPWISSLALIHSLVLSKSRNRFFMLSLFLVIITFLLCLLGIFLVRSGIISSVHSFTDSGIRGMYLSIIFLGIGIVSIFIYLLRFNFINSKVEIDVFSKESFLLVVIILLLVSLFVILLGTYYPLFIDIFFDKKISVGSPYYNHVIIPIFLVISFLIPVGLLFDWVKTRKVDENLWVLFFFSLFSCIVLSLYLKNILIFFETFSFIWVFYGSIYYLFRRSEFVFGVKYFFKKFLVFIPHISVSFIIFGITISSFYSIEKDVILRIDDCVKIGNYSFIYNKMFKKNSANYISNVAEILVLKDGCEFTRMYPEKRMFFASGIVMTEVSIYPSLIFDFYVSLGRNFDSDSWTFRFYYKPFIRFIWLGGLLIMIFSFYNSVLSLGFYRYIK
ncbi:MAG: cytochrome c-type biogenesis CcmF C-terminal domain-containing protein, partial [Enterobacteriaceae bacterium]|nr:cytochrome c-type biogenesis CcmF C-terminal domain-containing protein [Enterobacteriaceae bacterium]